MTVAYLFIDRMLRTMAIHDHSKSSISGPGTERLYSILPYNNFGLICKACKDIAIESTENAVVDQTTIVWCLFPENQRKIGIKCILSEKRVPGAGTDFYPDYVSLFLFIFVRRHRKTRTMQQRAQWPFKVVQGRWFQYQSKARTRKLGTILHWSLEIRRLHGRKSLIFFTHSHLTPSLGVNP